MAIKFLDDSAPQRSSGTPKSKIRFIDGVNGEGDTSPSIAQAVSQVMRNTPELQAYGPFKIPESSGSPLSDALSFARETLAAPMRIGQTLQVGPKVLGSATEEIGKELGYPTSGRLVGKAIEYAPLTYSGGQAISALRKSPSLMARVLTKSPKDLGPEFAAGEKLAGITDDLPVRSGFNPKLPKEIHGRPPKDLFDIAPYKPQMYPKDTNSFLNFADKRIKTFGEKLSPQELDDYKDAIAEIFRKREIVEGTKPFAKASKVLSNVTKLHNKAIGNREELNKAYGIIKTLRGGEKAKAIGSLIKKYGIKALEGLVLGGSGAYAAKKVFRP